MKTAKQVIHFQHWRRVRTNCGMLPTAKMVREREQLTQSWKRTTCGNCRKHRTNPKT